MSKDLLLNFVGALYLLNLWSIFMKLYSYIPLSKHVQSTWPSYLDSKSQVKVKGLTLELRVHSISPEPFDQFSCNFTHMFLLVRRCAEHMTQLPRLKVKRFTLVYCVRSISPVSIHWFSWNFTHIFLLVRRCAENMTQLPRLKVTGEGQRIYPWISCPLNLLNPLITFHETSLICSS